MKGEKNYIFGFVYIMYYTIWNMKIGVSNSPKHRLNQIRKSTSQNVDIFFKTPVLFPYAIESLLHKIFSWASRPMDCDKCDGYTEWFYDIIGVNKLIAACLLATIAAVQVVSVLFILMKMYYFLGYT